MMSNLVKEMIGEEDDVVAPKNTCIE